MSKGISKINLFPSKVSKQTKLVSDRDKFQSYGFKVQLLKFHVLMYGFLAVLGIMLPIIGPLYWSFLALRNLFKKYSRFYHIRKEPVYVADRRFSSGQRHQGYVTVKRISDYIARPMRKERLFYLTKGVVALCVAISLFGFQYSVYRAWDEPLEVPVTLQKGIVVARDGLNLRTEASSFSEVMTVIPEHHELEVISQGPQEIIDGRIADWIHVKYGDQFGWVWSGYVVLGECV